MDWEFVKMCLKLIFSLTVVLLLIFIIYRLLGTKVNDINNKKYMKVLERIQITKDSSLLIVKVGEKAYLMSNSAKTLEKIEEIPQKDIKIIEKRKEEAILEMQNCYKGILALINKRKGDRHES